MFNSYKLRILYSFYEKYSKYDLNDLLSLAEMDNDIIELNNDLIIVIDKRFKKGFITGSDISTYAYCPRLAYLKWKICSEHGYNGIVTIKKNLKSIALGRILHKIYAEYIAEGKSEFLVYDLERGLAGHIDELRLYDNKILVVELKTGHSTYHGQEFARIQLKFYMYLLSKYIDQKRFQGILLTRDDSSKSFKIWNVYLKEPSMIEGIVRDLRKSIILDEPPKRTENEKRCRSCILRVNCYRPRSGSIK